MKKTTFIIYTIYRVRYLYHCRGFYDSTKTRFIDALQFYPNMDILILHMTTARQKKIKKIKLPRAG